ncbi:hypothetical protein H6F51_00835 [Cyanobacteria bacterium FACHB-DQ100]|uniref:hypothetical protein n=1 Tax=unclassified Leptolyngbya TaxID=2650499 RepID=UPI0016805261|nr:hypothetical protein [Leptolyngbya sp. FACHB-17]MBD1821068.1 hypothetical protein [Cyanobacteria bacterium FACHB-DQ100]MBD2079445.1 hypothetical protein [Leptolyngbya sp. FACHB-17]
MSFPVLAGGKAANGVQVIDRKRVEAPKLTKINGCGSSVSNSKHTAGTAESCKVAVHPCNPDGVANFCATARQSYVTQ